MNDKDNKDAAHSKVSIHEARWVVGLAFLFVVIGVLLSIVPLIPGLATWMQKLPLDLPQLGDYMGGVAGSVWALAGLCFIYAAFKGQMEQLQLQQRELKDTREELAAQRKQLEIQNEQVARQNFENMFFHLLRLHHSIVQDIDLRGLPDLANRAYFPKGQIEYRDPETLKGRDAFRELFSRYCWHYDRIERQVVDRRGDEQGVQVSYSEKGEQFGAEDVQLVEKDYCWIIEKSFSDFYSFQEGEVGHYFRNLYHLVKYVDTAQLDDETYQRDTVSIIRAQLSSYELLLLFYYCLSGYGEEFKLLAEKYALFEHFAWSKVIATVHQSLYEPNAYGDDN